MDIERQTANKAKVLVRLTEHFPLLQLLTLFQDPHPYLQEGEWEYKAAAAQTKATHLHFLACNLKNLGLMIQ